MLFGFLLCTFTAHSFAQSAGVKKKNGPAKTVAKNKSTRAAKDSVVTLSSTGRYDAFASSSKLLITDPTVNRLNQRANGSGLRISGSGIVGMPKGSYGFANGHLLLRNTTATSSGTAYGSGAVGTGTSIQGVGTSEASIGVNGKNPYAVSWLWGDRQPRSIRNDSARRH
ncbi:hypothetical protein GCM10023229_30170 [Flavisolibacter ginsenosidimutans]